MEIRRDGAEKSSADESREKETRGEQSRLQRRVVCIRNMYFWLHKHDPSSSFKLLISPALRCYGLQDIAVHGKCYFPRDFGRKGVAGLSDCTI